MGAAVVSCIFPAFKAQGAEVLTIEGVAETWSDHGKVPNLQSANLTSWRAEIGDSTNCTPCSKPLSQHGATQCGFCTPGFIMQTRTLA
jgi:carbon-monoxide dehydrogenase small subunit